MESNYSRPLVRFNTIVNLFDGAFFGLGLGIASFTTVLPLFLTNLTNSAVLIGLIPAIHNVGWLLPQLLTARSMNKMSQYKPAVLRWTLGERLPFLFLSALALFSTCLSSDTVILLFFSLLIIQGLSAGITANPWQNMIAKVIPPTLRGTFFGAQASISNLMLSFGALIVGFILDKYGFPNGYAIAFLACFISMAFSIFGIVVTREEHQTSLKIDQGQRDFYADVGRIWRKDHNFRWFIVTRFIYQFGMMASAFFIVYSSRELNMNAVHAGALTSIMFVIQVGSGFLFGRLGDKIGHLLVFRVGALSAFLAALIAAFTSQIGWMYAVMVLSGMANSVFWTIGIVVGLEFGNEGDSPIYVGMSNSLIAPAAILAPLLGGYLADVFNFRITFLAAAVFSLLTFAILALNVKSTKK